MEDEAKATREAVSYTVGHLLWRPVLAGVSGSFQAWALHAVTFCIQREARMPSVSLILLSRS